MKNDYYKVLGIDKKSTQEQIKKAYRKMALKYHPDKNKDPGADTNFKEASEAYSTLSDPEKRVMYDQFGHSMPRRGSNPYGRGSEDAFTGFGDIFGDMFGFGKKRRPPPPKKKRKVGKNTSASITISLDDVFSGKNVTIAIPRIAPCDKCNGSGCEGAHKPETCATCKGMGQVYDQQDFITIRQTCYSCSGSGKIIKNKCKNCKGAGGVNKRERVKVAVPPGVSNGITMRLAGKGEHPPGVARPGDLHLKVFVERHKRFIRKEDDIHDKVSINFSTACLGGSITIPTLHGVCDLTIPELTQQGTELILNGKGCPKLNKSNKFGNHRVVINIEIPKKISREEKDLIRSLREIGGI